MPAVPGSCPPCCLPPAPCQLCRGQGHDNPQPRTSHHPQINTPHTHTHIHATVAGTGTGWQSVLPSRALAGLSGKGGQGCAGEREKSRHWGDPVTQPGTLWHSQTCAPGWIQASAAPFPREKLCLCLHSPSLPSWKRSWVGEKGKGKVTRVRGWAN